MVPLLSFIYVVLIALTGYAVLSGIFGRQRWHWAKLTGLSLAGGAGVIATLFFFVSIHGIPPNRPLLLTIALATISGLAILKNRERLIIFSIPNLRDGENRGAGIVLAFLATAVVLLTSANAAVEALTHGVPDVDSYAIWMFKAKIITIAPLRPIPAALRDPALSYSHQDYPFGFPFLVAGIFSATGKTDAEVGKTVLLPIYIALLCISYAAVRQFLRRSEALIVTAIFIGAPVLRQHAGMPVAEILLVLMHLCSLALLLEWITTGDGRILIVAGAFAVFAAFTKNEGLALLPLLAFVALLVAFVRRKQSAIADCLCTFAIAAGFLMPWLIYRRLLPHTHEDYGSKLTSLNTVLDNLPRLKTVLPDYLSHLIELNTVGGVWITLGLAALIGWRGFKTLPILILWFILLAHLSLYAFTFMVTPWDLNVLIPMISDKLLMHIAPAALLLIGLHLQSFRRSSTRLPGGFPS